MWMWIMREKNAQSSCLLHSVALFAQYFYVTLLDWFFQYNNVKDLNHLSLISRSCQLEVAYSNTWIASRFVLQSGSGDEDLMRILSNFIFGFSSSIPAWETCLTLLEYLTQEKFLQLDTYQQAS